MIKKVVILAGGKGTRLPQSAKDIPKALVPIAGKPMLAHQLDRLVAAGFSNIRLALGFRADAIVDFVREGAYPCEYVIESEPLGTGGAARFATAGIEDGPCMILNGDIVADFDFPAIAGSWRPHRAIMVSRWVEDAHDFGLLRLEKGQRIAAFEEKPSLPTSGYINAGCYIIDSCDLKRMPDGFAMLERDLFPQLAAEARLYTVSHTGAFWQDIGTEDRLSRVLGTPGRYGL